jgi:ribosomal protein S18 acetylase RimI-like enzyme
MSATFDIQRATPEDAPHIARLNAFVHNIHVEAHPNYFRPTDLDELTTAFRGWLARDDTTTFIARDEDGTPIGYMRTRFLDTPPTPFHHQRTYLELDQIAIHPDHRREGLAHALVELAREEARARGTDSVHLATWSFNGGAQAFFKSEGFEPRTTQFWQQLT